MGQGVALGIDAAHARAWVSALLIDTRAVHGTFRAEDALGPALGRTSLVVRQARAAGLPVYVQAVAVRAARRWPARVARGRRSCMRYESPGEFAYSRAAVTYTPSLTTVGSVRVVARV